MTTIPTWWLVLSGVLFGLLIIWILIALTALVFLGKGIKEFIRELKPLIERVKLLTESTHETMNEAQDFIKECKYPSANILKKVESLVDSISSTAKRATNTFLWVGTVRKVMNIFGFGRRKR